MKKSLYLICIMIILCSKDLYAASLEGTWSECFTDQGASAKLEIIISGTSLVANHSYFETTTDCSGDSETIFSLTGVITDSSSSVALANGITATALTFVQSDITVKTVSKYTKLWSQLTGVSVSSDVVTSFAGVKPSFFTFHPNESVLYDAYVINDSVSPAKIRFIDRSDINKQSEVGYHPIGFASNQLSSKSMGQITLKRSSQ